VPNLHRDDKSFFKEKQEKQEGWVTLYSYLRLVTYIYNSHRQKVSNNQTKHITHISKKYSML